MKLQRKISLLDRVRQVIKLINYSYFTEKAYVYWTKCFIIFYNMRHFKTPPVGFLAGDRENAFDLLERGRHTVFDKVHERFDGSQTGIAAARSIATIALQMFEEGQHKRCVDVLDLQG